MKFFVLGGHQTLSTPTIPLGSLVIREPDYGTSSRAITRTTEYDIKYVRITDFDNHGIPEDNEFTTVEEFDEKYLLEVGDLLFARSGATVGKTYLYDGSIGKAVFAGYCIRFRFDTSKVNPYFAFYTTKTKRFETWVASIQRPSGQPNINKEEFKSFAIPVPPLEIQEKLVAQLETARASRREKLAQADALLGSLDAWLLEQLGIKVIAAKSRSSFAIQFSQLEKRLDPKTYQKSRQTFSIDFERLTLGELTLIEPEYGSGSRSCQLSSVEDIKYIRITDFSDDGIPDNHQFVGAENPSNEYLLEHEDILFARSGATAGKTYIHDSKIGNAIFAGYCIRFRFNRTKILPLFIYYFTKTSVYKNWVHSIQRPSGQPNINKPEFMSFEIPVPPISTQSILVDKIQLDRNMIKRLRTEAEAEWQAAKLVFERALLKGA